MLSARLKQWRLARGLSLEELSAQIGGMVTKQALSKYETGKAHPSPLVLNKLAFALKIDAADLLTEPTVQVKFIAYRKGSSLPKKEAHRVQSLVAQALEERVQLQQLTSTEQHLDVEEILVNSLDAAEKAAETVRAKWNLGTEPVSSVVDVLESHLIHVLQIHAHERFDGIAAIAEVQGQDRINAAMVVTRADVPGERQRLNLTHELGHIVLRPAPGLNTEKMAFRFGAALLAPAETLKREVGTRRSAIGIDELLILKQRFGMSVQALLYRFRDLKIINESYYKEWCMQINRIGWKKREPKELAPEQPTWFRKSVHHAFAEGLITSNDFERLLGEKSPRRAPLSLAQKRAFLKLPLQERRQLLEQQAEKMAEYYKSHPDYLEDDVDED